jgi:hypothetical protein
MRRRTATSARSILHDHEAEIRRVLGDRDYQLFVRYLSGSVRLLQKLETATVALPSRNGTKKRLKMSPALSDEARHAIETLAEQLAGATAEFSLPTPSNKSLKLVKR